MAGAVALPLLWPTESLPISSFFNELISFMLWSLFVCALLMRNIFAKHSLARKDSSAPHYIFLSLATFSLFRALSGNPAIWAIEIKFCFVTLLCCAVIATAQRAGSNRFVLHCAGHLAIGAALAAAIGAVLGFIQLFDAPLFDLFVPQLEYSHRIVGNIRQANHFAFIAIAGMYGLHYLYAHKRLSLALFVTLSALSSSALVLSQSRTGYILFVIWAVWLFITQPRKTSAYAVGCTFIWMAFAHYVSSEVRDILSMHSGGSNLTGTVLARLELWNNNIALLSDCKWGCGIARYSLNHFLLTPELSYTIVANNAHNLLFDLLISNGWMLTILIISLCIYLCWRYCSRRTFKRAAFPYLLSALLYCQLEHPYTFAYFLLPNAFLLGLLCRSNSSSVRKPIARANKWLLPQLASMVGIGSIILGAVALQDYWPLHTQYMQRHDGLASSASAPIHFQHPHLFYEHMSAFASTHKNTNPDLTRHDIACASYWLVGAAQLRRTIAWAINENEFDLAYGLLNKLRTLSSTNARYLEKSIATSDLATWQKFQLYLDQAAPTPDWHLVSIKLTALSLTCRTDDRQ
jgi:O-Antigen ligase